MHLAIGSFISNDDSNGSENGKKKQCSGLALKNSKTTTFQVHHNFCFISFAKRKNKQTERTLAGTPQQLAVANYSVYFFAIAAQVQRETSLLVSLSFTHSKFILSQGGSE